MNCEEFEELSGAYAIGALPASERASADAHLAGCDKHPDLASLLAVVDGLALAAPEVAPPSRLKARLMEAIKADMQPMPLRRTDAPRAARRSLIDIVVGWFGSARLGYGMAAVMGVVVAALLVWNVSLQGDDASNTVVVTMTGQASGEVLYFADRKVAVMDLHGLEDLPPDKVYEVWALSDGRATALGVIVPTNGSVRETMEFDATGYDTIAVTVEPAPGVDQPTTDPITLGDL